MLFSLSSSLSSGRKHFWFSNLRNRDGISTRRLNVGVFTLSRHPWRQLVGFSVFSVMLFSTLLAYCFGWKALLRESV